jgi:mono/diheme cytochrome c family protein
MMKLKIVCILVAAGVAGAAVSGTLIQQAPAKSAALRNPLANGDKTRRAGAKLYARECAACHGAAREGRGHAPALNHSEVHEAAPGSLFWVLRNGSRQRGMPSFAHLPEAQRWQIVTFLQNPDGQ